MREPGRASRTGPFPARGRRTCALGAVSVRGGGRWTEPAGPGGDRGPTGALRAEPAPPRRAAEPPSRFRPTIPQPPALPHGAIHPADRALGPRRSARPGIGSRSLGGAPRATSCPWRSPSRSPPSQRVCRWRSPLRRRSAQGEWGSGRASRDAWWRWKRSARAPSSPLTRAASACSPSPLVRAADRVGEVPVLSMDARSRLEPARSAERAAAPPGAVRERAGWKRPLRNPRSVLAKTCTDRSEASGDRERLRSPRRQRCARRWRCRPAAASGRVQQARVRRERGKQDAAGATLTGEGGLVPASDVLNVERRQQPTSGRTRKLRPAHPRVMSSTHSGNGSA